MPPPNEKPSPVVAEPNDADCHSANPYLEEAKVASEELRYEDAQRALQAAIERPGNCKDTLFEIYFLKTLVDAAFDEYERCQRDLEIALQLKPDFVMTEEMAPKLKKCVR